MRERWRILLHLKEKRVGEGRPIQIGNVKAESSSSLVLSVFGKE
jgi:hypothetical protein